MGQGPDHSAQLLGEVFALALARKRAEENLAAALAEIKRLGGKANSSEQGSSLSNFGLTAAEAYVAIGVARGETLISIATRRGITVATARTQLRSVFSKLGAHRQSQLVAVLSRSLF